MPDLEPTTTQLGYRAVGEPNKAFWLYRCASCGHEDSALKLWFERTMPCPQACTGTWERIYTKTPSVQSDVLQGGPRWLYNLDKYPVWVETKTQFQRELLKRDLVLDVRDRHNTHDESPWATKTRLKPGHVDPFVPADGMLIPPDSTSTVPSSSQTPEKTTGTVGDETKEDVTKVSVDLLTLDQMRTIREYEIWLKQEKLEQEIFCLKCWDKSHREDQAKVNITAQDVSFVCACSVRYGRGETKLGRTITTMQPVMTTRVQLFESIVPNAILPSRAVQLLERYQKDVLRTLSLAEALRCERCESYGELDGCNSQVKSSGVLIECRCLRRTSLGLTM